MQPSFMAKAAPVTPGARGGKKADTTNWSAMATPPWGVDPGGPEPAVASWAAVPPNPLSQPLPKPKAPPPPPDDDLWDGVIPGPPGSTVFPTVDAEAGRDWIKVEMAEIQKRRAGRAET